MTKLAIAAFVIMSPFPMKDIQVARLLAYVTGLVNQQLFLPQSDHLVASLRRTLSRTRVAEPVLLLNTELPEMM